MEEHPLPWRSIQDMADLLCNDDNQKVILDNLVRVRERLGIFAADKYQQGGKYDLNQQKQIVAGYNIKYGKDGILDASRL